MQAPVLRIPSEDDGNASLPGVAARHVQEAQGEWRMENGNGGCRLPFRHGAQGANILAVSVRWKRECRALWSEEALEERTLVGSIVLTCYQRSSKQEQRTINNSELGDRIADTWRSSLSACYRARETSRRSEGAFAAGFGETSIHSGD